MKSEKMKDKCERVHASFPCREGLNMPKRKSISCNFDAKIWIDTVVRKNAKNLLLHKNNMLKSLSTTIVEYST